MQTGSANCRKNQPTYLTKNSQKAPKSTLWGTFWAPKSGLGAPFSPLLATAVHPGGPKAPLRSLGVPLGRLFSPFLDFWRSQGPIFTFWTPQKGVTFSRFAHIGTRLGTLGPVLGRLGPPFVIYGNDVPVWVLPSKVERLCADGGPEAPFQSPWGPLWPPKA